VELATSRRNNSHILSRDATPFSLASNSKFCRARATVWAAIAVAAARVREAFPKEIPEETCGREHDKTAGKPCERLANN